MQIYAEDAMELVMQSYQTDNFYELVLLLIVGILLFFTFIPK